MPKLIKCRDCGNQVSQRAKICPSCGAPAKAPMQFGFVSVILLSTVVIWFLFQVTGTDSPSRRPLPAPSLGAAESLVRGSDGFDTYKSEFAQATRTLINDGRCRRNEFIEIGGWVKSMLHKDRPIYFTYCGGNTVSNRLYLDVSSGRIFK